MAQCLSKRCGEEVETGWLFCAYCGTDNRPKTFRPLILACPHLFYESEGFCVRCGECRDSRPTAAQRATQEGIGKKLLFLGFLVGAVSVLVWQIHLNRWPGNEYIASWYEAAVGDNGQKALQGDQYVSWGETGGMVLFGLGVLASIAARLNSLRPGRKQPVSSTR